MSGEALRLGDRLLSLRDARRLAREDDDRVAARRAAPEPAGTAERTTAGELTGNDVGRPIELDHGDQHAAGTLRDFIAGETRIAIWLRGADRPIWLNHGHPVVLGPHPEASER